MVFGLARARNGVLMEATNNFQEGGQLRIKIGDWYFIF